MRASGNGTPSVCADNLLKIVRGEVPFERVKGLDPRLIDRPMVEVDAALQRDADWLISTYEPRATVDRIHVEQNDGFAGGFVVAAEIKGKEA